MSDALKQQIADLEREADARRAWLEGKPVEFLHDDVWRECTGKPLFCAGTAYRRKPTPARRPWSKPKDVPGPVCWLREKHATDCGLIVWIDNLGVGAFTDDSATVSTRGLLWKELHRYEHSTDRKTWAPCTVEEVA